MGVVFAFAVGAVLFVVWLVTQIVTFLIQNWFFTVPAIAVAGFVWFKAKEEADRQAAQRRHQWEESQRQHAAQKELERTARQEEEFRRRAEAERQEMVSLSNAAAELFCEAVSRFYDAEHYLDEAENSFQEGLLHAFWDSFSDASRAIRECEDLSEAFAKALDTYRAKVVGKEDAPLLPVSTHQATALEGIRDSIIRLRALDRKSDRIEAFANVRTGRRMEEIIGASCRNLQQGLTDLSGKIEVSMQALSRSIDDTSRRMETLSETMRRDGVDRNELRERLARAESELETLRAARKS